MNELNRFGRCRTACLILGGHPKNILSRIGKSWATLGTSDCRQAYTRQYCISVRKRTTIWNGLFEGCDKLRAALLQYSGVRRLGHETQNIGFSSWNSGLRVQVLWFRFLESSFGFPDFEVGL